LFVTGVADDGSTFASAQVSTQTAEARINSVRDEFCEMMTKINKRLAEEIPGTYNLKDIPEFHFQPLSIEGKKALREKALELWEKGVVSTEHMLKTQGYSIEVERENRKKEKTDGTDETLLPRDVSNANASSSTSDKVGRPEMDDSERTSDPDAAIRGKMPKPSNSDGSMGDES